MIPIMFKTGELVLINHGRFEETGLLPVFRLFMVVQIGLILILMLTMYGLKQHHVRWQLFCPCSSLSALGCIWSVRRGLGVRYLPLALLTVSTLPIVGQFRLSYQAGYGSIDWMILHFSKCYWSSSVLISWYGSTGGLVLLVDWPRRLHVSRTHFLLCRIDGFAIQPGVVYPCATFIAVGYNRSPLKAQRLAQSLRGQFKTGELYCHTGATASQERNHWHGCTPGSYLSGMLATEAANSVWLMSSSPAIPAHHTEWPDRNAPGVTSPARNAPRRYGSGPGAS
jgi:hypothetical protein